VPLIRIPTFPGSVLVFVEVVWAGGIFLMILLASIIFPDRSSGENLLLVTVPETVR